MQNGLSSQGARGAKLQILICPTNMLTECKFVNFEGFRVDNSKHNEYLNNQALKIFVVYLKSLAEMMHNWMMNISDILCKIFR